MPTGAELFVYTLGRFGIREIFTLVGDHLNEVLLCAAKRGMRIFDMRHESAVVHAADAWARIHRKPAVALVTGGPGHTNALTGIATAYLASSPVICVSGSRPANQAQRNAFQDIDQLGMTKPVVKWVAEPTSATQIPYFLGRAYAEAMSGRPGPVHLTIPVDVFKEMATKPTLYPGAAPAASPPHEYSIEQAANLLQSAERPLIVAGSGVWWSRAETDLLEFVDYTQLPVFTITLGRGAVPDTHPLCFGHADPALNRIAARAFGEADVILILGKRIDFRLSPATISQTAKVIQVDIHAAELGMNRGLEVAIHADARTTLHALRNAVAPKKRGPWIEQLLNYQRAWQSWLDREAATPEEPIHPAAAFAELRKSLPENVLYSWDGGDFCHWGRAMMPANEPGGWLRLGPLGTIGAALPNGLALQMAHPDRPVVIITGDGALGFYISELDTAVRHNLPVVIIVGNDAGWGLERELQGVETTVGCELRATRYDIVMQGFGGEGENITSLNQLAPAIRQAFTSRKPYLLNVNVKGVRSPFTRWKLGDG